MLVFNFFGDWIIFLNDKEKGIRKKKKEEKENIKKTTQSDNHILFLFGWKFLKNHTENESPLSTT